MVHNFAKQFLSLMDFDPDTFFSSGTALPKVLRDKVRLQTSRGSTNHVPSSTATLEASMDLTSRHILIIQKQLQKGEEIYLEEANHNCHLYRGWETMMDVRLDSLQPARKITNEQRWFSNSNTSHTRHTRSFAIGTRVRADTRPITILAAIPTVTSNIHSTSENNDAAENETPSSPAREPPNKRPRAKTSQTSPETNKTTIDTTDTAKLDNSEDVSREEDQEQEDAPRRVKRRSSRKQSDAK